MIGLLPIISTDSPNFRHFDEFFFTSLLYSVVANSSNAKRKISIDRGRLEHHGQKLTSNHSLNSCFVISLGSSIGSSIVSASRRLSVICRNYRPNKPFNNPTTATKKRITMTTPKNRPNVIQSGDNTHHHDHAITPHNFKVMKTNAKRPGNPIPQEFVVCTSDIFYPVKIYFPDLWSRRVLPFFPFRR